LRRRILPERERKMATATEIARAAIAAWNAHDLSRVAQFYRPDIVMVSADAGELKGREQASERDRVFMEAFPDGEMEISASYDSGDTAIVEWLFHGTNTGPLQLPSGEGLSATGKRVSVRGADVVTFEGGAAVKLHSYYDQVELLTQLGLMPGSPAA
jgi:ketosteroid isomerase-like protein